MKLCLALTSFALLSSTWAGPPGVGSRYTIETGGQQRTLVVSGKGIALRAAGDSLRIKTLPEQLNARALRDSMRQAREAQPNLTEVNFLMEEPLVRGGKDEKAAPLILTCQVHVTLNDGADVNAVAATVGVAKVDAPAYAPGQYIFHCGDQGGALALMEELRKLPAVKTANAMMARTLGKKFTPNDTYFAYNASYEGYQWHLKNTGQNSGTTGVDLNVSTAWDTVKGTGVTLGIIDDGVEITHPDLAPNYLASASWDFRDSDSNPSPMDASDNHGTSVAGLAVAAGNNGAGVSGVAPSAKFAALRIDLNTTPDDQVADALAYKNDIIQIKSNSYGPEDTGYTIEGNGPLAEAALLDGVTNGRAGRGVIYTVAAGNGAMEGDNSNYDGFANSIYTIAVAGVSDDGTPTYFAEPGANIVVSALGDNEDDQGITTTDRTGADGYNIDDPLAYNFLNPDYTIDFGGTSACAPEAAGVVALMLQTKSTLGWRDVQEILISSATQNHATDLDWTTNAAGYHFNHKYGAGLINAAAAVTKAGTWTNLGTQTSVSMDQPALNLAIPDYPSTTGVATNFDFSTQAPIRVEHATVTVDISHPSRGELEILLISPSGMVSRLAERHDDLTADYQWTFMSVRHWGEQSTGTWKLQVIDREKENAGTIVSATVKLYGTASTGTSGAPVVTSAGTSSTMVNAPFTYQITATNAPTSFSTVAALPSGLTLNAATGLISGNPNTAAVSTINLRATNASGTSVNRSLTLTVNSLSQIAAGTDNFRNNWVTGGTATWGLSSIAADSHDGADCAKPAALSIGGYSYMKTWVDGPAVLSFWWKVSAGDPADKLYFYLDSGSPMKSIGNTTTYAQLTYYIPVGRHSIRWEMYRDSTSTAAGAVSTGFVDQVVLTDPNQSVPFILNQPFNVYAPQGGRTCLTFDVVGQAPLTYQWKQGATVLTNGTSRDLLILPVPATSTSYTCTISNGLGNVTTNSATVFVTPTATADSLANALESSVLGFGTQPTLGWSRQTTVTHDGVDALKSGAIGNGASSVLQTCVTGPATVKFWWKVSSEKGYDYLDLNQDGANRQYLSGEEDWQETETYVYSGSHIVEWKYSKDSTGVSGTDAGYVDGITLIPNGFSAWRAQQFSIAQQNAAGITSALDDPDHDGLNNLLEYALGLNPNVNSRAGLPIATVTGATLEYTYVDDWDHLDVLLIPEISTTLNGTWTAATPTEVSVTGSLHTMKVTLPITSGKNFMRLRIREF